MTISLHWQLGQFANSACRSCKKPFRTARAFCFRWNRLLISRGPGYSFSPLLPSFRKRSCKDVEFSLDIVLSGFLADPQNISGFERAQCDGIALRVNSIDISRPSRRGLIENFPKPCRSSRSASVTALGRRTNLSIHKDRAEMRGCGIISTEPAPSW